MCVTSVSRTHLLPPTPAVFTTTACASTATSCAIMDYSEAVDTGSGCGDENCSSAFGSSVSHSDQICPNQEPLFGLIVLGGFAKYTVLFAFCISHERMNATKVCFSFLFFTHKIYIPLPSASHLFRLTNIFCRHSKNNIQFYFYVTL